ncbi:MAG: hypothetical protein IPN15_22690 [Saprospiraceae bacterium]|nr:hypothetical protein [Candidatus Vicinibacter affinis]
MKTLIYSICILLLTLFLHNSVNAQAVVDFETGSVLQGTMMYASQVIQAHFFLLKMI